MQPLLLLMLSTYTAPPLELEPVVDHAPLVVFTASSTVNVIEALSRQFEAVSGIAVRVSAAGSQALARQIVNGAPADLLIAAHPRWINFLTERKLIAMHTTLAANQLVVVVPQGDTARIQSVDDLAAPDVRRIALADPLAVPAGIYARQALTALQVWEDVEVKLLTFANVRQALTVVERGEVDAGVVYATDARQRQVRIAALIDPRWARPTVELALLRTAEHRLHARQFYAYLQSPAALDILTAHGFSAPPTTREPPARVPDTATAAPVRGALLSAEEWSATTLSLLVASCAVLLGLPFAVVFGYLLARREFAGKWIIEAAINLPLVVPPVVTGYLLLVCFGRNGMIGGWLDRVLGVHIAFTWMGAALAAAVVSFPLMLRAVRLSFEHVDPRLVLAARGLGAGRLAAFLGISLPLARRGVFVGAMLAFARSLGEFGATIMLASNIAGQTRTIPLAIYHTVERSGMAPAWRLVILSIVLASGALLASELLQRNRTTS